MPKSKLLEISTKICNHYFQFDRKLVVGNKKPAEAGFYECRLKPILYDDELKPPSIQDQQASFRRFLVLALA